MCRPKYHGHGIGHRVIEFIENDNPDAKTWELVTPFESYRNHYFYEKLGYVKVNEYKHSEALTMFEYKKKLS